MVRSMISPLIAATALCAVCIPVNAQTAATGKVISDQILPKETYLYVSVPNVTELKNFVSASSMGQLWNDPEFDAFKDEVLNAFGAQMEEGLMSFQEALGMSLQEFLEIPDGEVSLAFSTAQSRFMGAVIFVDFGDRESRIRELLDKAVNLLAAAPQLSQEDDTFDGTELTLFKVQHNGPAPTPLAEEFGWFIKDQRLVFANRSELLESVLTNWDGESDQSFQSNEAYSYIMSRCEADDRSALSTIYFDPMGLMTKLVQTGSLGPQLTMGASMAMGVLPQLGLNQMKAMGTVSRPGSGDFEAVTRSVFYAEQPPRALMQALQLESFDAAPPEWIKDNATAYAAMKWKIGEAYTAVESVADMFAGAGFLAGKIDELAGQGPGIHIKQDIIDQLTGELRFASAPGPSDSVGGDQIVVVLGVKDDAAANGVVSKIAGEIGLETREFRGATIYEMSVPGNAEQSIGVTISEGRLIFGMGGNILEQILRNDSDMRPLAESEDYQRVAQHFPRTALSVQFSRPAEQYRSMYEMLRSGNASEQFPGSQDFFEKIDFTTLPSFDVVAKYIHPAGGYTVEDDNGFFMEGFQLKD